jgi:hypothetical protein
MRLPEGSEHGTSKIGGGEGDRTPYLLNAIQTLYQVSYAPDQKWSANLGAAPGKSNVLPAAHESGELRRDA